MTSKIHVALPNSSQILVDTNMGDLRVALIEGHYSKNIDPKPLQTKTEFGNRNQETIEHHNIKWGNKNLSYDETIPLQKIHDAEGPFIITRMVVLWSYEEQVVHYGIPQTVQSIARHEFKRWAFKPKLFKDLFDRMPSHPLYQKLLNEKRRWMKKTGDRETFRRLRDTWLINRSNPADKIPFSIYKLWYEKGAMILPESTGDFRGRELGTEYIL